VDDAAGLPWNWILIRASGIAAWGLLTAVVLWGLVLATRLPPRITSAPRLLAMHRWLGALALLFTGVHIALLLIDPVEPFTVAEILIPFTAPWEPVAVALGTLALWLLLPVSVIGRLRSRIARVNGAWFTRAHWLAYCAWPLATAHYVLAGTDALAEWSLGLLVAGSALVVAALLVRGNAHRRPRRPTLTG
jgi:predicted ferric reductase